MILLDATEPTLAFRRRRRALDGFPAISATIADHLASAGKGPLESV